MAIWNIFNQIGELIGTANNNITDPNAPNEKLGIDYHDASGAYVGQQSRDGGNYDARGNPQRDVGFFGSGSTFNGGGFSSKKTTDNDNPSTKRHPGAW